MKIENQVCSLDQAKKLKELGVSNGSAFVWFNFKFPVDKKDTLMLVSLVEGVNSAMAHANTAVFVHLFPAFTAAELGELLPSEVTTEREPGIEMHVWVCADSMNYEVAFPANTEAQAKADLLIWLLEKGHETPEDANARLANA